MGIGIKIPLMKCAFSYEHETRSALAGFILSGKRLSMADECAAFEREMAAYQGSKDAVLFNSGASANLALMQSMKNLGRLEDGDAVGFSGLTWPTNIMPLIQMKLRPVPVDCNIETLNSMSHNLLDRLGETSLKAFFITNAMGFSGDLDRIRDICHERGIILLEDNCEALGTELYAGKTGTFGMASTFSFFVAHHMSTIEGGMVTTGDPDLADMLRIVRANGWDRNLNADSQLKWRKRYNIDTELDAKYTFYDLGFNLRPTEITGFIGRFQLRHLNEYVTARADNHARLETALRRNPDLIALDRAHIKILSAFAFPVMCKSPELRKIYISRAEAAGVEIRPMLAGNMERQPFYKRYVAASHVLPGVDSVEKQGFYFGNYPELTGDDMDALGECLSTIGT